MNNRQFVHGLITYFLVLSFSISPESQVWSQTKIRLPKELKEVSGLTIDDRGTLWWHNDGNNGPLLFQTDTLGNLLDKRAFPYGYNEDWEDITQDSSGWFYIGDFGNNLQDRQDLTIYKYHFGNSATQVIRFRYEDQNAFPPKDGASFDCEAFFWHQGTLFLFTKDRLRSNNWITRLYTLRDKGIEQTALLRDSLLLSKRVVTAAAIHTPSKQIALLTYRFQKILGIFPHFSCSIFTWKFDDQSILPTGQVKEIKVRGFTGRQYEAIDFASANQVWIGAEKTFILNPVAKKIQLD